MNQTTSGKSDGQAFFRTQVRMAAVQISGLSPAELKAALAYEVEPFSGIPAAEAEIDYAPAIDSDPAMRAFEVTVRRRGRRRAFVVGAGRWRTAAMVFAAVVFFALAADYLLISRREARMADEVRHRQRLDDTLKDLRGKAAAFRAQAGKLRSARESAVRAQEECARARAVYPQFFAAVASAFGNRAVLRSFKAGGREFSMEIRAVAVSALAASETMAALGDLAARQGWSFAAGSITSDDKSVTVEFNCSLWK